MEAALRGAGGFGTVLAVLLALVPPALAQDTPTEDADWRLAGHDAANTRFSALGEINKDNVARLRPAFTLPIKSNQGQPASPLVAAGMMFVLTPFPNTLYAFDLANPGAAKWTYTPAQDPFAQGLACCDGGPRGPAFANGRIFFNTLDGQTIALEAASGQEVWKTKVGDTRSGETLTMAPLVTKEKVIVGNSGVHYGARGWIAALDAATGALAWKSYTTGADSEVRIGNKFSPFYRQDRGQDLGLASWPPGGWRQGGGTVSGFVSYDPELDLIIYGTDRAAPLNADQRSGDNQWTSGVFARDPQSGDARWFYQFSPHDVLGYGGGREMIVLKARWRGSDRKLVIHPDANGYVYVLDAASGEVLSANPYVHVNANTGVDLATGRAKLVPSKITPSGYIIRDVCPASAGAKGLNASAFAPSTGLLYIPTRNLCMDFGPVTANYIAGLAYAGAQIRMKPGPGGYRGELVAWDVSRAQRAWSVRENFPLASGVLATAGDLVFYGTLDGWLKALEARSGAVLWQFHAPSGIVGQPITYRGPDGRQYVAVLSGIGGSDGALVSDDLDARDSTAASGFAGALRDLPPQVARGGSLHVFALP
jgi:PQQ-dependent dehydrogenase (methanol/ethanol family)